ncbi:UDP-N-acetylmuramoyl-tripeptide--D-alanyl-D-alanine ligase [Enterobacteriaceae endosymbiont of Plateumaris braccata]|uniref:UDP-N-acetylmuramoyl-tripeptide--D-alanyl-D- alanine ligase n=1 Tax=Enterobacteriaceae endosymbiont of Plateumaris braccata TaxID=2675793 RepID=UPI00144934EB|nr:UDP-N-acetylmuramoyl-tripeptide--D-alanyl-D-alanine ligase [Enterobacteriaceae endosymbiont of Plateumaris braccata]QJC28100.1 UDP-N-acetylmuramoyl-tripeptide--D-alanyl-D-alanine ligase [Enterobacteriaceae endosymbiont of Plateumaris braccata]
MNEIINLKKLTKIVNGKLIGENIDILNFSINSKKIDFKCLFIAIRGKNFDGHNFVQDAINNGALAVIVNKYLQISIPQIIVFDTIISLGKISLWKRLQSKSHFIGITGSSGKTSVKEMTVSILKNIGKILFTKDNMNNIIGVSLTLLNLNSQHKYIIIELGGNNLSDIKYSSNLVRPNTAIINNISVSHLEGFKSFENIVRCKSHIFQYLLNSDRAIINFDDVNHKKILYKLINKKKWTFSIKNHNANFFTSNLKILQNKICFNLHTPIGKIFINLFIIGGLHNVSNALAASALSLSAGASLDDISKGLASFRSISGRLSPIKLGYNKLILNDTYNANPQSVIAAINVLKKMNGKKILVIGDMMELGSYSFFYHNQIKNFILKSNLDFVLSIGLYSKYITKYNNNFEYFLNKKKLITRLIKILTNLNNFTILFKGSRKAQVEVLINMLLKQEQFK